MTGIERLENEATRMLFDEDDCPEGSCTCLDTCESCRAKWLYEVAGQIKRELREERDSWDEELCESQMDKTRVMAVYLEMNRHVLGHEGAEDSQVSRWSRELWEALGGEKHYPANDVSMSAYEPLPPEDREAIAWVREHGGLGAVRKMAAITLDVYQRLVDGNAGLEMLETDVDTIDAMMAEIVEAIIKSDKKRTRALELLDESVPRATYERHILKRQRQIDESHAALRRRNARVAELERERDGLRTRVENQRSSLDGLVAVIDEMRPRLMPEGMEWPRFEDGEPVRFGDAFACGDETFYVDSVQLLRREFHLWATNGRVVTGSNGERCERPAPKVLDADGVEIRVGDTVYSTRDTESGTVVYAYPPGDDGQPSVKVGAFWHHASELTHRAPVLDSDGKPLREGETVWSVDSGTRYTVEKTTDELIPIKCRSEMGSTVSLHPSQLTHERPDTRARVIDGMDEETVERIDRLVKDGRWLDD